MNFKIDSVKVKAIDQVEHVTVKVTTLSGQMISATLPASDIPALETLGIDVTREIKKKLREDLRQMELPDESQRGMHRE